MISHVVELTVPNATAEEFYDFMINPNSTAYHQWWPEEHLQFYMIKRGSERHLGDEVFYDEYLGEKRKLAFRAVVITADRPNEAAWQMKKGGIRLPAVLRLELHDTSGGIRVTHKLQVGFRGIGRIFDPLLKLYMSKPFQDALEEHCRTEWPKLAEYLGH